MAFESYGNRPSNFVGKDGFHWWIGQIEKTDENTKNSNRYKVRIIGHHLADCENQGTDDLPWANTVAPTTDPFTAGGGVTTRLSYGDWVIGFFMDSEMSQQPYILGSIGAIRNARGESDASIVPFLNASQEGCRAFKNFAPGPVAGSPYVATSLSKPDVQAAAAGQVAAAAAPPGTATNPEQGFGQPPSVAYSQCSGSAMNEAAVKCTIISQANCPTGKTASMLELVLSEMFKAISESGGQIGTYLTSKVTGYVREGESFIMGYVNKIMAIIFQGYGWLKGKLYNLVQQGVQYLINTLLSLVSDKGKPKDAKPPYNPKKPEKILDIIQKFLEDTLAKIGCSIENLYDKILKFLTDFLMKLVNDFWSEALCGIEAMVNSLMNSLQNFVTTAINAILQPLLNILNSVAAPLDGVFSTISEIMSFLGIRCSGLPAECKKPIEDCGEGPKTKAKGLAGDLDRLLAAIAADTKPSPSISSCEDALSPVTPTLNVAISGGIPLPTTTTTTTPTTTTPTTTETTTPTLEIIIEPTGATKNVGSSHTFTVVAITSDNSGINYQWQKLDSTSPVSESSWSNVSGANSSSYTISNLVATDSDDSYRCVCSSSTTTPNSVTSDEAYIYVNLPTTTDGSPPNAFFQTGYATLQFLSSTNITTVLSNTVSANYSNANTTNVTTPSIKISGQSTVIYTPINIPQLGSSGVTYDLSVSSRLVSPGDTLKLILTTTGISNGTKIDYYIFGVNLQLSDISTNSLTGSFVISNNTATSLITISKPVSFSKTELVFAALSNGGAATQFAIEGNPVVPTPTTTPVTPKPPIACTPIVSSTGQIISIPLCSPGTPYIAPPSIYIQGNGIGYGASAVADLDTDGYLRQIRVVRPGRGYPPNPPQNLDCVITGFTIIKPGFGYDVAPVVFIDGDPNVAEAVIANGVLVDIKIKDKSKTFTENPSVKIISASKGVGAVAIGNITCLDKRDVRELAEIVGPTPVGQYVDCP
jgi:hypothetical protein